MGITILDSIEINGSGISLSNCYSSFCSNVVTVRKLNVDNTITYGLEATANIWKDYDSRCCTKTPITNIKVRKIIDSTQLETNVYTHLYTALKSNYINTQDV